LSKIITIQTDTTTSINVNINCTWVKNCKYVLPGRMNVSRTKWQNALSILCFKNA